jgi:two-component system, sensor histidine kinase and response regulator
MSDPRLTSPAPAPSPVDVEAAVARLGRNVDLYRHIYAMFRVDGGSMVEELGRLVVADQREHAQRVAHTLQGLGGTMGATQLAAAAQRMEAAMAGADSNQDASLLTDTAQAFAQACCCIERALQGVATSLGAKGASSL